MPPSALSYFLHSDLGGEKDYTWVNQTDLGSLSDNYDDMNDSEDEEDSGDKLLVT